MVQAEAQNQEEAFDLDILGTPSGQKLADQILTSCGEKLLPKKLFSTVFLTGKGVRAPGLGPAGLWKLVCGRRKMLCGKELFQGGEDRTILIPLRIPIFCLQGRLKAEVDLKGYAEGGSLAVAASYRE